MDKCVNRPFKEAVQQSWEEWLRMPRALTQKGNLKQPTRQDVLSWVSKAWHGIKTDLLVKVCGISNALDGSQDDLVCDKVPAVDANSTESESEDEEDTEDAEDPTDSDVDDLDPFDDIED